MGYEGVKYELIREGSFAPQHNWLIELQHWCVVFHENKLAPFYEGGSHGNLSFRVSPGSNSFIITAAKSSLKESVSDYFFFHVSKVDPVNNRVYASGIPEKQPSSEAMLHGTIYQERPEIMAVLHGHCPEITNNPEKAGIITTKKFVESGTPKIIHSVMEVLDDHFFIEIKDHGFIALGKTIEAAGQLALEMRKKAMNTF